MPNWCYTSYVVEGDRDELEDLHAKLMSLQNLPEPQSAFSWGKLWLRNVLKLFDDAPEDIGDRGELSDYPELSDVLRFQAETAWAEINGVWDFVVGHYKSLKYYFSAEEPGSNYYVTNDESGKYFERYLINDYSNGQEYYSTRERVLSEISERIGEDIPSWGIMVVELEKYNDYIEEGKRIFVYEFTVIDGGVTKDTSIT